MLQLEPAGPGPVSFAPVEKNTKTKIGVLDLKYPNQTRFNIQFTVECKFMNKI